MGDGALPKTCNWEFLDATVMGSDPLRITNRPYLQLPKPEVTILNIE